MSGLGQSVAIAPQTKTRPDSLTHDQTYQSVRTTRSLRVVPGRWVVHWIVDVLGAVDIGPQVDGIRRHKAYQSTKLAHTVYRMRTRTVQWVCDGWSMRSSGVV